jgi:RNA polymerase sigma factor for flagellar operon FliA
VTQNATPPRGRRPDLAAAMVGTLAVSRRAVERVGDQRALSLTTAVEECAAYLESYARRFSTSTSGRRPKTMDRLVVESFQRWGLDTTELEAAYDTAKRPKNLDTAIATVQHHGADGERLAWALISVEALRHIPLVWHQANKLAKSFPEYTAEDLAGWGWQGLRIALRAYDPERFAFSTYACTRISGTIRDGVRAENPIPKRLGTEVRKLSRLEEEMTRDLGRIPTLNEVAGRVGVTWEHAQVLARCVPTASLEEMAAATLSGEESAVLSHDARIDETVASTILGEDVASALAALDAEAAEAVRLLVLEERTLQEACEITGTTPRQLRARKQRGLDQLAEALADWREHVA